MKKIRCLLLTIIFSILIGCSESSTQEPRNVEKEFSLIYQEAIISRNKADILKAIDALEKNQDDFSSLTGYYYSLSQLYYRIGDIGKAKNILANYSEDVFVIYKATLLMSVGEEDKGIVLLSNLLNDYISSHESLDSSQLISVIIMEKLLNLDYEGRIEVILEQDNINEAFTNQLSVIKNLSRDEILHSYWPGL